MHAALTPKLSTLAIAVAATLPLAAQANPVTSGTFVSANFFQDAPDGPGNSLLSEPGSIGTTTFTPFVPYARAAGGGVGEPSGPQTFFGVASQDAFGLQIEAGVASRARAFVGPFADDGTARLNGGAFWRFDYTNSTGVTQRATFSYGFSLSTIHRLADQPFGSGLIPATGGLGTTRLSLQLDAGSGTLRLGDLVVVNSAGPAQAGGGLDGQVLLNTGGFGEFEPAGVALPAPGNTYGFNATDFLVRHEFVDIAPGTTRSLFASLDLSLTIGVNGALSGGNCCAGLAPYCLTTEAVLSTREGFWGWSFAPVGGNGGGGGGGNEIPLPATLALAAAGIAGLAAARRRRGR